MQLYYFVGKYITESDSRYKSKLYFFSSYVEKKKQSLNETRNLFPQVRKFTDQQLSLISTRDIERNTLNFAVLSDEKVSKMEFRLDKISVPDKIQLHRKNGDILYSDCSNFL